MLCRFIIEKDNNVLKGCIHHSLADGWSLELLLRWIVTGYVPEKTMKCTVRSYAAWEAKEMEEGNERLSASIVYWEKILGDTPERFDCDMITIRRDENSVTKLTEQLVLLNGQILEKLKL